MNETIEPDKPYSGNFEDQNITKEKLQAMVPKGTKITIDDDIVNMIKSMENDTGVLQQYLEEQLLANMSVLREAKISMPEYIRAVKFVALKQNTDIIKAWAIVFPKKYDELMAKKKAGKPVNEYSYASNYDKTKAVQIITKQTLLHPSILFAPYHGESVRKMYNLMNNDDASYKVQLEAAIALESATRMPEDKTLKVSISQSDAQLEQQKEMSQNIGRLVEQMQNGFKQGIDVAELQKIHVNVIDVEAE